MRSIAFLFVAAMLAAGLGASGPALAQQPQQPHPRFVVDGKMWLASSPETRRVFLVGVANMIALETAYSKRKGTPPPPVATMATKAAEGLTLDQMSERVTTWYEANPGRHDMPVMGVMWLRMIEPHATGK